MKINKLNITLLLAAGLLMQGCTKEFLDVPSNEIVEAEDGYEIFEPEGFITGVYGMFTSFNYGFAYLGITEIISDNADKGSAPTDSGTDKDVLDNLTFNVTTPSFRSLWEHWYKSIGRASIAIEYTEDYEMTNEELKNRLIAEARFLRALNYFFLVRGWGEIPIQEIDLIERKPVSEVYAYIEADLQFAINHLPLKSEYPARDLGRATKGAAQGLLAKVYLYQEKWQDAVSMAEAVLNSGEYALEPDYATIWRASTENGPESLFEFQARGQQIAHGVHQYSQTQGARGGQNGWGWGFNTPSQNLLNAFNEEGDEIRRDATIIFRGETLYDGRVVGQDVENAMYNEKAYSSANAGADDTDKNIRYLRLGEIYLILAEAANEMGDVGKARENLNIIRDRVNLEEVTSTDQPELRELIWKERRLELAFEHDRWFDLVRTKRASQAMEANGKRFQERHYLFPVPDEQLIQTPEMTQNPGW
ncbi:RagB/SusD family nutrient uptake outer membrane protein [Sphingobacterium haloxyli]|uniref:RagB/SusD family nutrient uptake outer membrane protein n=1 Tax=Sphingobacterium haloxyli TaxID=2100533 RepID=A0A2S9J347_9SPHI|nr:RagB/SusD family nutrient uptake outer membrane protein [Sphingobacterium haloxyli]PRD47213.1 RagB/SusD family nutrient uptake outer membrane protein [Sphingobacterium haloxyli]